MKRATRIQQSWSRMSEDAILPHVEGPLLLESGQGAILTEDNQAIIVEGYENGSAD